MKQKIVGNYYAGNESVQLVLRGGYGGDFYLVHRKGSIARVKIGADDTWEMVMTSLFHEIFEFLFDRSKCRFTATNDLSNSASAYLFVASHYDFSDVCAKAAEFVVGCLPDLKKAYKAWNKKK